MSEPHNRTEAEWKKELTPEEYRVLRKKETEVPFSGTKIAPNERGIFACRACGNELFSADAQFDSGTGWPSFDEALPGAIVEATDSSHGMRRTEINCSKCESHLGHAFDDGPTETGKRYCVNSICLS